MCDVCDISNTVLYDLLYHKAFELPPTVNKKGLQVGKGSQEPDQSDQTPAQPELAVWRSSGKIHHFPAVRFGVEEGY